MKLASKMNPKNIFRSKKSRSVSRSNPSSFSSASDSSDSSSTLENMKEPGKATPTSVLHQQVSGEWSEMPTQIYLDLVQAFKMIDKDGDGKISRKDLELVLSRVGPVPPSEEELTVMLSEVDRNGDGCISLEEFGAISSAFGPPSCDSELRDAFNFFDADHDGLITAEELHAVFAAIGDDRCTLEECRRMISGVDKNGDGFVCFEDFSRMMEQQR